MDEPTKKRDVKAVRNMFHLVEILMEQNGAQVTELSDKLGLAKSTVHQHLTTLCDEGYAIKKDGEYHVGLQFLTIGEYTRQQRREWPLVKSLVQNLAEETEERAQYIVEENGRGIYLYTDTGERAVKAGRRSGKVRYLHSSAGGKAILAHMSEEKLKNTIRRWGLPKETQNTITDSEELYADLKRIRQRGYSINKEESISGLWAIGVPIVVNNGPVGALSVSGPRHRIEVDWFHSELPELLLAAGNELEINIEFM